MSRTAARPRGRRFFPVAGLIRISIAAAIFPVIGLLGGGIWFLDLLNHFQAQYFVVLVTAACLLLVRRRWAPALLFAALAMIPGWRLLPFYRPLEETTSGSPIRAAAFNVHTGNDRHDEVIEWVRRTDPDLIYLCEIDATWNLRLASLSERYPHSIEHPVEGNFGFLFLSKFPVVLDATRDLGQFGVPLMEVVVATPSGMVTVFGAHPVPPLTAAWSAGRDRYLTAIATRAAAADGRVLVLGDLNATRWSHAMKPVFDAGLHDTALGRGFSATWKRINPLVCIPIDHVLSRGFSGTIHRETGPDLGSDHRPVFADLAW